MQSATIYAAGSCNLRCKHCSVGLDHINPREALSTDQLNSVVTNLAKSDVRIITLLGGEVTFARDDLVDVYRNAAQVGAKLSLNTNLSARAAIEPILRFESCSVIVVSLDGISAATHDKLRGKGQFRKTAKNLVWLLKKRRLERLEFEVQITFVINRLNASEASKALLRLEKLGVDKVNFNHLVPSGRAKIFEKKIIPTSKDLIETTAQVVACWLMIQNIDMSIYVPPALARYMEKRWGITDKVSNPVACGGPIDSYGYVDLNGNHLPCPAMAKEENPNSLLNQRSDRLDLVSKAASEIWEASVFKGFERSRLLSSRTKSMWPCQICKHSDGCYPCTAPVIKGEARPEVRVCSALFEYIRDHDPATMTDIFSHQSKALSDERAVL